MESPTEKFSVLVLGGCGFVGFHLVNHLVKDPGFTSVAVVSRTAASNKNQVDGATYHAGDLKDEASIERILSQIKPSLIIHAACPSPVTGTPKEYDLITVQGTQNLLKLAKGSNDIRALIYISSSTLAKGPEHLNLTEEYPLANTDRKSSAYARTKALAEISVLKANEPFPNGSKSSEETSWVGYLSTAALRFPIVYGTHDPVSIPGCLTALQKGHTNVQLGDGKNMWSFCSARNACVATSVLAHRLLSRNNVSDDVDTAKVDGEAFNIHDGASYLFWEYARTVWRFAGHKPKKERIMALPSWFVLSLASVLEWVYWIFTFGTKRPYNLGKQQVEYACFTHTYSIDKAQKRLGYKPVREFEKELSEAVTWSLESGGWNRKLMKVTVD